ncbi:CotH kinase family protein, partial [Zavarzinella formosa]|uniref:CotH kinase family protein n=1 Tax=Zavarzinella formosa TaxID=360055 RepID=UPI001930B999
MNKRRLAALVVAGFGVFILASPPEGFGQGGKKDGPDDKQDFPGAKGGFGPGGKGGGFGPMGGQERKIVKDFDKNNDGWLNAEERKAARATAKGGGGGFRGPKGGFGKGGEAGTPGPKVAVADAKTYPDAKLYEPNVLRTLFLEFENKDWESELEDFHGTDVDVPATLIVDGKKYPNVGVHFRGMSSYGMVSAGSKRSLNLAVDLADDKQRLYGYKTLNLLNSHEDPTFMSTVLYSEIARKYLPTPKANFVKVVINGESWGVYGSVQQFNKDFTKENFNSSKGARWKVRGSPGGGGGLEYLGDNVADYKRRYEIKSKDDDKDWKALIALCKVLNETPADKLEEALKPMLDIDGLLWFLALDVALINGDGYWVRASDYSIYMDEKKIFHMVPHDMNEAFRPAS